MRFMVIVRANKESEAGVLPSAEILAAMNEFNEGLARDGVLLAAEGLQASAKGARMKFAGGGKPVVTDGPFAETKELIAGFWLVQAKSKEEVTERYGRCPFTSGEEIEIRQVFEADDFGDALTPQAREFEARRRA
ncbi:MAG: YciI family protein [Candidatus Tumulicola sp.]